MGRAEIEKIRSWEGAEDKGWKEREKYVIFGILKSTGGLLMLQWK